MRSRLDDEFPYVVTDERWKTEVALARFRYKVDALAYVRKIYNADRRNSVPISLYHGRRLIYEGGQPSPPAKIDRKPTAMRASAAAWKNGLNTPQVR